MHRRFKIQIYFIENAFRSNLKVIPDFVRGERLANYKTPMKNFHFLSCRKSLRVWEDTPVIDIIGNRGS